MPPKAAHIPIAGDLKTTITRLKSDPKLIPRYGEKALDALVTACLGGPLHLLTETTFLQSRSFLEICLEQNIVNPIRLYLQTPGTQITPAMHAIAKEKSMQGLSTLEQNLPVYRAIQNNMRIASTQIHCTMLHVTTPYAHGQTLLHLAAAHDRVDILKCYPLFYLNIQVRNAEKLTPFETALHSQSLESISLFCTSKIPRTMYETNIPIFNALISLGHYAVAKLIYCSLKQDPCTEDLLIDTLSHLTSPSPQKILQFNDALQQAPTPDNLSMSQTIATYAKKARHLEPWFLTLIAGVFNNNPTKKMEDALKSFCLSCIMNIESEADSTLKMGLQFRLHSLLFALAKRTQLILNLRLDANQRRTLDATIAHGLCKPFYCTQLSEADYLDLLQAIEDRHLVQQIAALHFQAGSFHQLFPAVIAVFNHALSYSKLSQCASIKKHSLLSLLMLERLSSDTTITEEIQASWQILLTEQLPHASLQTLLLLYHFCTQPTIRQLIEHQLNLTLGLIKALTESEQISICERVKPQIAQLRLHEITALTHYLATHLPLEIEDTPSPWLNTLKALVILWNKEQGSLPQLGHWVSQHNIVLPYFFFAYLEAREPETIVIALTLSQADIYTQIQYIKSRTQDQILRLVRICLDQITHQNTDYTFYFRKLLTRLLHLSSYDRSDCLASVKMTLGSQDMSLLKAPTLKNMAEHILSDSKETPMDHVYNGVWIQRLLSNLAFVAEANTADLDKLIERYRFISLTLKQEELATISTYQIYLSRLNALINTDVSSRRQFWITKRENLLKFRADDAIRELLNQLENICNEMSHGSEGNVAKKAKTVLSTYYLESLASARTDGLFKLNHWIYKHTLWKKGDLAIAQSTIRTWLSTHLYHHHFIRIELENRPHNGILYNQNGVEIGFLDEHNEGIGFINSTPLPLIKIPGIKAGNLFYNQHGELLGTLTSENTIQLCNVFQQDTSITILTQLSEETLAESPEACKFLAYHLLQESNLTTLYQQASQVPDTNKLAWIETLLHSTLNDIKTTLTESLFEMLVEHHDPKKLIPLLNQMPNIHNRKRLFLACVKDRNYLLQLSRQTLCSHLYQFLDSQNVSELLAECLIFTQESPALNQLLLVFGLYPKQNQRFNFLEVVHHCFDLIEKRSIPAETKTTLFNRLVQNKETAVILFQYYLTVPQAIAAFAQFFNKESLMQLLTDLNQTPLDVSDPRYHFVIIALTQENNALMPDEELRYSSQHSWQYLDLKTLLTFFHAHYAVSPNPIDPEGHLTKQLFNKLLYRAANHGLIELFYPNNHFNPWFLIPDNLERAIACPTPTKLRTKFQQLFSKKLSPQREFLMREKAIVNWQAVEQATLAAQNYTHSTLKAFLINYSGRTEVIKKLIHDIFDSSVINAYPEVTMGMGEILITHPHKTISRAIFSAL